MQHDPLRNHSFKRFFFSWGGGGGGGGGYLFSFLFFRWKVGERETDNRGTDRGKVKLVLKFRKHNGRRNSQSVKARTL